MSSNAKLLLVVFGLLAGILAAWYEPPFLEGRVALPPTLQADANGELFPMGLVDSRRHLFRGGAHRRRGWMAHYPTGECGARLALQGSIIFSSR